MSNTKLSPKELEVIAWSRKVVGNKRIAQAMGISHETVKVHKRNAALKLGVSSSSAVLLNEALSKGYLNGAVA